MFSARCAKCDIELEPEAERCPRCLRKSTVVSGRGPRFASRGLADDASDRPAAPAGPVFAPTEASPPAHATVRLVVLLVAWAAAAPALFVLFSNEEWLTARRLWLGAIFAGVWLATMPLRVAFSRTPRPLDARGTARHYAVSTFGLLALAPLLFGVMGLASMLVASDIAAIFVGVFFFLVLLLGVPALVGAVRGQKPVGATVLATGKAVGLAALLVGAMAAIVALRATRTDKPKTIYIPENPKGLLDPLDIEHVAVKSERVRGEGGLETMHLSADGGSFERTKTKLLVAALQATDALKQDARASGEVRLWLPAHLGTLDNQRTAREEEDALNGALRATGTKTAGGRPVHVGITFGTPPEAEGRKGVR